MSEVIDYISEAEFADDAMPSDTPLFDLTRDNNFAYLNIEEELKAMKAQDFEGQFTSLSSLEEVTDEFIQGVEIDRLDDIAVAQEKVDETFSTEEAAAVPLVQLSVRAPEIAEPKLVALTVKEPAAEITSPDVVEYVTPSYKPSPWEAMKNAVRVNVAGHDLTIGQSIRARLSVLPRLARAAIDESYTPEQAFVKSGTVLNTLHDHLSDHNVRRILTEHDYRDNGYNNMLDPTLTQRRSRELIGAIARETANNLRGFGWMALGKATRSEAMVQRGHELETREVKGQAYRRQQIADEQAWFPGNMQI